MYIMHKIILYRHYSYNNKLIRLIINIKNVKIVQFKVFKILKFLFKHSLTISTFTIVIIHIIPTAK